MRPFLYWITLQIISSKWLPFEVGSDDLPVLGVGGSSTKSETIENTILRTLFFFIFIYLFIFLLFNVKSVSPKIKHHTFYAGF